MNFFVDMIRGTAYDDGYITRKLASLQTTPTYLPHIPPYGRTSALSSGYYQPLLRYRPRSRSLSPSKVVYYYPRTLSTHVDSVPVPRTRVRYRSVSPVRSIVDYSPLPAPRFPRLPPPSYYDYDYGYGGSYSPYIGYPYGYGYGYSVGPRMSRYDSYLEDDEVPSPGYTGRYGRATRLADSIVELEKEKLARRSPVRTVTTTTYTLPEFTHTRSISPRMLQDEVDKLRYKMKGLSYTMDTSEPTPSVSQRARRANSVESARRYTSALHLSELPRLSERRTHVYPQDDYMKDNLRIRCLSHYKSTRSAAALSSTYTSKHPLKSSPVTTSTPGTSKWEEPSTIYSSSDKQPFSKEEPAEKPKEETAQE